MDDKIGGISTKPNKSFWTFIWFCLRFILSLQCELLKNGIMEMNKITREEVLRRYQSTRERKEKRLEEMKEILYKRYVNRTGEEPKYFFAL